MQAKELKSLTSEELMNKLNDFKTVLAERKLNETRA